MEDSEYRQGILAAIDVYQEYIDSAGRNPAMIDAMNQATAEGRLIDAERIAVAIERRISGFRHAQEQFRKVLVQMDADSK